jgi:hypothetical protein
MKPPKESFKPRNKNKAPLTGRYCAFQKKNQWLNSRYVFNNGR